MSTEAPAQHGGNGAVSAEDLRAWRSQTRIFLQPIAAPSILGLFGFAGATFMVSANMAGWFGTAASGSYLFPFAAIFGGLAQFIAGLWAYRARDGLATAMHGMWGSFWIGYGILWGFAAAGAITLPAAQFIPFGYWFIVLATLTFFGTVCAAFENISLLGVLGALTAGSASAAVYFLTGVHGWEVGAGWVLQVSAWLAAYTGFAMMLEGSAGKVILPLGALKKDANIPGHHEHVPLQFASGEPGVRHGQ